ncbi:hypothetical protein BGZ46_006568 [Entomortierella lignicola]|nr:hypothetical protein BGZ46_006568 [Entomortierella lignicola]
MAVNTVPGPVPGPNVGPGPGPGPGPAPAGSGPAPIVSSPAQRLDAIDEQVWLQLGSLAESMGDHDRAMAAYESALRHNYHSVNALNQIAELYRSRENFPKASEYFQRILGIDNASGEVWGSLGHCYLMMDELQKAYNAYQNALHHLPNPKDSKLWYGIGILYDRYGSVEHAEEAFSAVMRMDPKYEKANEIYFRLGIIYKGQQKYAQSLECFRYILHTPPRPLTEADIWFQIGHVHEQQKEYTSAKEAYERVLTENPNHAKVLQQLGWLYHQQNAAFMNQDLAIKFLTRSIESDNTDAQSWYLMGRCYMAQQKYNKAYEAYQQAVYRDSRNPTFWCSIGLLYFQINQYRDALDAYSKAIRINPNISEVWYDLGTLYESCNNQVSDAIDAYQRASDLDPENQHIKQRLTYLRQNNGAPGSVPPPPEEMNPNAYPPSGGAGSQHSFNQRSTVAPQGPPTGMQGYTGRQQAPPAPLSASMNGEHQHSGRDLPLPGNGNGLGNNGQASGSPGYMGEERQPHIPGINSGGPRPPTPAGAMPQMMSGERMQGPPPSAPGHSRPTRGRPQSPPLDGPGAYPRPGSPGLNHPSNGHGHDPHYPQQHPYGHGPPPTHNMMHGGPPPPQGYERQDQGPRPKQEQVPQYQHHRQRSGDMSRPGIMDEGHGVAHQQRRHPSDPHAHSSSPPRDDRRAPMAGPGYNPQTQPPQHNTEDRWTPTPSHHGRHPSEDQMRDVNHPQMGGDRGQGIPRNLAGPESFPGRNDIPPPQAIGVDPERRDQRSGESHHPSNIRPGSDQGMKDLRQGGSYEDQQQQQHPGRGRDYESSGGFPEQRTSPSNWPPQENRTGGYREENQDQVQDEIAASLVSLSGKGYRGSSVRPQDDDYDMEEPERAISETVREPPREDNNVSRLGQEQQHHHHQQQQHLQQQQQLHHHHHQQQQQPQPQQYQHQHSPSPHPSHDTREQVLPSRPVSQSQVQVEQQVEPHQEHHHAEQQHIDQQQIEQQHHHHEQQQQQGREEIKENNVEDRPSTPSQSMATGTSATAEPRASPPRDRIVEAQQGASMAHEEAPQTTEATAVATEAKERRTPSPVESMKEAKEAEVASDENGSTLIEPIVHRAGTGSLDVGGGASESSVSKTTSDNVKATGSGSVGAAVDDEDTEMEEGEVREDEDEVMSSGAVSTTVQGGKDSSNKEISN